MISMRLEPDGETVVLELTAYLGQRFDTYRSICSQVGARYDYDRKLTYASVSVLPQLLALFSEAELAVGVDEPVRALLASQADEARRALEAGRARLAAAEALLDGLSPFPFQRTGVEWLAPRSAALLSDEMGLGKTVQCLMALPERARALGCVPGSLKYKWAVEVKRWRPDLAVKVVEGRSEWRWPREGEVVLCSWGMLPDPEEVPLPGPGVALFGDEFHLVKNKKTLRRKRWDGLARHADIVWGITGTPLLGKKPELWSLLDALGLADVAFGSRSEFNRAFDSDEMADVPDCLRKVMLRRKRSEVLPDLPKKVRSIVPVAIDSVAQKACDELDALLKSKGIDIQTVTDVSQITRVAFEMISRVRSLLATAMIPTMLEMVEEYEEERQPLMVVSCHRGPIDALQGREGWAFITGDTSMADRQVIQDDFQAGKYKGVAGTIGPMGTGLDLYHASHGLFVDSDWTPANNSQAEDRLVRIGATADHAQFTYLAARHPLVERIHEILREKQELIDKSVEAAAVSQHEVPESPDVKLAAAAEVAQKHVVDLEARAREEREKKEREKEKAREFVMKSLGDRWDGRHVEVDGRRRGPCNNVEEHAGTGMMQLAAADQDFARELNGKGFSRFDGEFGHSLAAQYQSTGMLTEAQWKAAIRLAKRYRRQIGDPK